MYFQTITSVLLRFMRTTRSARAILPAAVAASRAARNSSLIAMEAETKPVCEEKGYVHYDHTDECKHLRWTARESYQFMYDRPWQRVVDFYSDIVKGSSSLSDLFGGSAHAREMLSEDLSETCGCPEKPCKRISDNKSGRWARVTFKVVLSYHGHSFDGWQKQPGLNTVQGVLESSLGRFVDDKKAQMLKDKSLPVEPCSVVAGRTDKGVTALKQVFSFHTWRNDITIRELEDAINSAAPGMLRTLRISEVSRVFHPNFSAKWRRYFYIFPLINEDKRSDSFNENVAVLLDAKKNMKGFSAFDYDHYLSGDDDDKEDASKTKPTSFSINKVNQLLQNLEGKSLSYKIFARDTKASRSNGPPTECYMFHARAAEAELPSDDMGSVEQQKVMCVELVANRFLRKMVRVLVATSIREAAAGADDDALLRLVDATCRRATSPPAPPDGLCLAEVGYEEFVKEKCLIS